MMQGTRLVVSLHRTRLQQQEYYYLQTAVLVVVVFGTAVLISVWGRDESGGIAEC